MFHTLRSWLNADARPNIPLKLRPFATFHSLRSWSNAAAFQNIHQKSSTAPTSHLLIGGLRVLKSSNKRSILVTAETFHSSIGPYFLPPSEFSYPSGFKQYAFTSSRMLLSSLNASEADVDPAMQKNVMIRKQMKFIVAVFVVVVARATTSLNGVYYSTSTGNTETIAGYIAEAAGVRRPIRHQSPRRR